MSRHSGGWYKAHRDAWAKDLGQNVYLWGIWNALLHMATWKESQILWEGQQRVLQPGSVVFGVTELALRWDCSRSVVQKWLHHLHDTGRIVLESCSRGSLVTICNWSAYQQEAEEACSPRKSGVGTAWERRGHGEALKKKVQCKKEEYISRASASSEFDLEAVYKKYPRKVGKTQGIKKLAKEIHSQEDYQSLLVAVDRYSASVRGAEPQFIKHFSSWATSWRDWLDLDAGACAQGSSINTTPIALEAL